MNQDQTKISQIDRYLQKLLTPIANVRSSYFCLSDAETKDIISQVQVVLSEEKSLIELQAPVQICGDIHGQFIDLMRIFADCGDPSNHRYLFLGDYVDRGQQSLETICLLFCYKIKYTKNFILLRGNHESATVNNQYGFYDECRRKLSLATWKKINTCFQYLPIAAVVENTILCMHGGLSPELVFTDDINSKIVKPIDIKTDGLLTDLMWSDPTNDFSMYMRNEDRGIAHLFGKEAVSEFLERNNLEMICRAHQCVEDGYEFMFDSRLVTIFSASNYCGEFDNSGSVMIVNDDLECNFHIFRPHERHQRNLERKEEEIKIHEIKEKEQEIRRTKERELRTEQEKQEEKQIESEQANQKLYDMKKQFERNENSPNQLQIKSNTFRAIYNKKLTSF